MPSARTATTATVRSSTGGICHARVISHAAIAGQRQRAAQRQHAQHTASSSRGQSGAQQLTHRQDFPCEDPVADRQHRLAVADDEYRRTGPGPRRRWRAAHAIPCRASRCAVGSSSSSTGAGEPSTRARPSRCRWPSDKPTPPRPITVSRPSGSAASTSSNPAARQACRGRQAVRTVPGCRGCCPARATGRCASHATCATTRRSRSAKSTPSTRTSPGRQPENRLQQRGLADAVGSGQHGHRPGSTSASSASSVDRRAGCPATVRVAAGSTGSVSSKRKALSAAVFPSCAA